MQIVYVYVEKCIGGGNGSGVFRQARHSSDTPVYGHGATKCFYNPVPFNMTLRFLVEYTSWLWNLKLVVNTQASEA